METNPTVECAQDEEVDGLAMLDALSRRSADLPALRRLADDLHQLALAVTALDQADAVRGAA